MKLLTVAELGLSPPGGALCQLVTYQVSLEADFLCIQAACAMVQRYIDFFPLTAVGLYQQISELIIGEYDENGVISEQGT
jgi:hypothetical protein